MVQKEITVSCVPIVSMEVEPGVMMMVDVNTAVLVAGLMSNVTVSIQIGRQG